MKRYPVGVTVPVEIPLVDLNGDSVTPMGVFVRIVDGDDVEILASQAVTFNPADNYVAWNVPVAAQQLSQDEFEALRVIEISIETAEGTYRADHSYVVVGSVTLSAPQNSFQTRTKAIFEASRMLDVGAFAEASEYEQIYALRQAHLRLTRLRYKALLDDPATAKLHPHIDLLPVTWQTMTAEEFAALPSLFRAALCRAQVAEAARILTSDPVRDRQDKGLLSESVGESSMMFRSVKPLDLGVGKRTLEEISRYVQLSMNVGRA